MDERVKNYLGLQTDDPEIRTLLMFSVGRVLNKAVARRENWSELVDERKIGHIVDWLRVAIATRADWLTNIDDQGRPKKLMKFGSIDAIVKEADKAMRLDIERASRVSIASGEERLVVTLTNGMTVVEMLTETALDRESSIMQHCVGNGGYDAHLGGGERAFYSIRDANGKPHVTLEVNLHNRSVVQTRGKQNTTPADKYMSAVKEAVVATRLQIEDVNFVLDRNHEIVQKSALPEHLRVYGNLFLSGYYERGPLPLILSVELDLSLKNRDDIQELPSVLSVGRSIYAAGCGVRDWRRVTMVVGHLDLTDSHAELLSDTLAVGGDLLLRGTRITKFPNDLGVGRDLDLTDTGVVTLPESLSVSGTLTIGDAPVESIPVNAEVGTLDIRGSVLRDIPAGVVIHNDLVVDEPILGGKLRTIAPDVKLGGVVKVVNPHFFGHFKAPGYYKGRKYRDYSLEEIRDLLDSDFVELPF
ncbi:PcfJ domain-containing protein [Agrobacterium salinitolerans]|nr:PcfJ domain-containing protein [Agrobacterium salinitolerans]